MNKNQANCSMLFKSLFVKYIAGLCLIICFFTNLGFAEEPQHLRHSIRALGMGNAFTAAVNDEHALYYNPAGLQSIQQHAFEVLSLNGTVGQNFIDMASEDSDDASAFIGQLIGKKMYMEVGLGVMSLSGPGWGYALFAEGILDIEVHNPTVPTLELKAYAQAVAIGGLAFDFFDETLDIGFNLKAVNRYGIGRETHIVEFLDDDFADNIEDEFVSKTIISPDVGIIYHFDQLYNLHTKLAMVVKNIGGMDFGSTGSIPMTIDIGAATESELAGFDIIIAIDYVDLTFATTEEDSMMRNLKMGAEVGIFKRTNGHHALSFRVGRNGVYTSYGVSLNPPYLPIKIDYASWSEEVGSIAGEIEDKRQSVQLAFNF